MIMLSLYTPWRHMGDWSYCSTDSESQGQLVINCHLYVPAHLPPNKKCPVPTEQEAGWVQEPIQMFWRKDHCQESNHGSLIVQPVRQSLCQLHHPGFLENSKHVFQGFQVRASSCFQLNQPTRCSNFSSLLLVV